jgi:predicted metal-dependent hydrolase
MSPQNPTPSAEKRLSLREAQEMARRLARDRPGYQERTQTRPERVERREGARPLSEADAITREAFKDEVRAWAQRLEVEPLEIHLTGMRRKWGSCSPRNRLTFDTGLLRQPEQFRREAILHELLHLKVRNHGQLFRALLSASLAASHVTVDRGAM